MLITLLSHTAANQSGGGTVVTSGINTTGATLLIIVIADGSSGYTGTTVSDSNGNTWNRLVCQWWGATGGSSSTCGTGGVGGISLIFYSYAKGAGALSVGAGHTFTMNGYFGVCMVSAWSGTKTYPTNPFDQQNGANNGYSTVQTGSITPSASNSLIISGMAGENSTLDTVDSGLTILDAINSIGGSNFDGSCAYIIQGPASAINPTWSPSSGNLCSATIASFLAQSGTNYTSNLSDTISISESIIKGIGLPLTDTFSLLDSIKKSTARTLSEVYSIAETITRNTSLTFTEALIILETFSAHKPGVPYVMTFAEVIGIVESLGINPNIQDWAYIRNYLGDVGVIQLTQPSPPQNTSTYEDTDYIKGYL